MRRRPPKHQFPGLERKVPIEHLDGVDANASLLAGASNVNVRRSMIVEVDEDDDTEEARNLGHAVESPGEHGSVALGTDTPAP
jgi:hypothetical protein